MTESQPSSENISTLLSSARAHYKERDYSTFKKARGEYQQVYDSHKDSLSPEHRFEFLHNLAHLAYHLDDDWVKAKEYAISAISAIQEGTTNISIAQLNYLLGSIYVSEGDYKEALPHLEVAKKLGQDKFEVEQLISQCKVNAGSWYGKLWNRIWNTSQGVGRFSGSAHSDLDDMIIQAYGKLVGENYHIPARRFDAWCNEGVRDQHSDPIIDLCKNVALYVAGLAKYTNDEEALFLVDDLQRIKRDITRVKEPGYNPIDRAAVDELFKRAVIGLIEGHLLDEKFETGTGSDQKWKSDNMSEILGKISVPDKDLDTKYAGAVNEFGNYISSLKGNSDSKDKFHKSGFLDDILTEINKYSPQDSKARIESRFKSPKYRFEKSYAEEKWHGFLQESYSTLRYAAGIPAIELGAKKIYRLLWNFGTGNDGWDMLSKLGIVGGSAIVGLVGLLMYPTITFGYLTYKAVTSALGIALKSDINYRMKQESDEIKKLGLEQRLYDLDDSSFGTILKNTITAYPYGVLTRPLVALTAGMMSHKNYQDMKKKRLEALKKKRESAKKKESSKPVPP